MNHVVRAGLSTVFVVVALIALSGCGGSGYEGPPRAEVSGAVTFDGTPIVEGSINLVPVGQGRQVGVSIIDGAYTIPEIDGPTFGKYKVEITGFEFEKVAEDSEEEGRSTQVVPSKYNTDTTLELDISEAKVEKDFTLTTE